MSKHFMALTESLSVIRSLNSLNPLITGKTSYSFLIWQPPAFPYRHQYSIIGRFRLNHRVRDVDGCFPKAHRHQKIVSASQIHQKLLRNSVLRYFVSLVLSCSPFVQSFLYSQILRILLIESSLPIESSVSSHLSE